LLRPRPLAARPPLVTDNSVLLCCSRQAGKSTTVAALAVHTALFRVPALTLILAPSQRRSGETFRKIKDAYNALGRPAGAVVENQSTLELANGSRVVCLPGKEATVRSFSAVDLLILDEAARVADDLYRTVRPMLAVSSGRRAISCPEVTARRYDGWRADCENHDAGPLQGRSPQVRGPSLSAFVSYGHHQRTMADTSGPRRTRNPRPRAGECPPLSADLR
jgi:hypothetical protein